MLANLLQLIEKLEMDEIVIDRPNYSQRIKLVILMWKLSKNLLFLLL